jgi:hypothetical protein
MDRDFVLFAVGTEFLNAISIHIKPKALILPLVLHIKLPQQ